MCIRDSYGDKSTQGRCLYGVGEAVAVWSRNKMSLSVRPPYGAKQTIAEVFENHLHPSFGWFKPVDVTRDEVIAGVLPPGAIIVYFDPESAAWSHRGGCGPVYP